MLRVIAVVIGLAMQVAAAEPPQILEIYRDFVKPGSETAYVGIEKDAARICAEMMCPHPYMGIESLTGPKEVWFFNGYSSAAELEQTRDGYKKKPALLAALDEIGKRKVGLIAEPSEVFPNYRRKVSSGTPWAMEQGRYLVITVTQRNVRPNGTVFETEQGIRFVIAPARTRDEADAKRAAAGSDANIFAIRPYFSMPAAEWVAADPEFWSSR
jgi:hypothetical protein